MLQQVSVPSVSTVHTAPERSLARRVTGAQHLLCDSRKRIVCPLKRSFHHTQVYPFARESGMGSG